jgi:hypothetical protein
VVPLRPGAGTSGRLGGDDATYNDAISLVTVSGRAGTVNDPVGMS